MASKPNKNSSTALQLAKKGGLPKFYPSKVMVREGLQPEDEPFPVPLTRLLPDAHTTATLLQTAEGFDGVQPAVIVAGRPDDVAEADVLRFWLGGDDDDDDHHHHHQEEDPRRRDWVPRLWSARDLALQMRALEMYRGGRKLWTRKLLVNIELQLKKGSEYLYIHGIDGHAVKVKNLGYDREDLEPRVKLLGFRDLVAPAASWSRATAFCSYRVDWVLTPPYAAAEHRRERRLLAGPAAGDEDEARRLRFLHSPRVVALDRDWCAAEADWRASRTRAALRGLVAGLVATNKAMLGGEGEDEKEEEEEGGKNRGRQPLIHRVVCFGLGRLMHEVTNTTTTSEGGEEEDEEAVAYKPDRRAMMAHAAALDLAAWFSEQQNHHHHQVRVMAQDPAYSEAERVVLAQHGIRTAGGFGAMGFAHVDGRTCVLALAPGARVREVLAEVARPAVYVAAPFRFSGVEQTRRDFEEHQRVVVAPQGRVYGVRPWVKDPHTPRTAAMGREYMSWALPRVEGEPDADIFRGAVMHVRVGGSDAQEQ